MLSNHETKARIYLDNAASTPMYPEVIREMTELMSTSFGNPSSIHFFGRNAKSTIEEARKVMAQGLGASQGEIFFTSGGTEANNTALKCAVRDLQVSRIITSPTEHHSVLHSCRRLQEMGVLVSYLNIDALGRPDQAHLEALLAQSDQKTLVSLMHANNEVGTMLNLRATGDLCAKYGALFHTDAVQTVAHFPINLSELKVSFLSASAHKFHGPKGVGILYVNSENIIQSFIDGGGQERNMRAGTENIAGIKAMASAFQICLTRMRHASQEILQLKNYAKEEIRKNFPKVRYNGDQTQNSLYTVLSATFPKTPNGNLLLLHLDIEGISTSGGSACASGAQQGSHVLAAIGVNAEDTTIRISFSEFNTKREVDLLIEKLVKILE